jgi:hypothetical protein
VRNLNFRPVLKQFAKQTLYFKDLKFFEVLIYIEAASLEVASFIGSKIA